MAGFTVRVHLRHSSDADEAHEILHSEMEKRGFSRTITVPGGATYELPWGTYDYEGERPIEAVLQKAEEAAKRTGHEARILVTESAGRIWCGLKTV